MGTASELKLTMRPYWRFRISFAASRLTRNVPTTLALSIFSMEAAGVSKKLFIEATAAFVDCGVQPAVALFDLAKQGLDLRFVGDVGLQV